MTVATWRSFINGVAQKVKAAPTHDKPANQAGNGQMLKIMKFDELTAAEIVGYSANDLQYHFELL